MWEFKVLWSLICPVQIKKSQAVGDHLALAQYLFQVCTQCIEFTVGKKSRQSRER